MHERLAKLAEVARVFLKIGAMSYGGPAIMGIMQAEIQEKRNWISKPQFVEGLALVNMLPGPGAAQLAIFIGHARAGLAGGILAGVGFLLPGFLIMLGLASAYVAFGGLPATRSVFYGIGPVVVGIFTVAVFRLGKAAIKDRGQIAIGLVALVLLMFTSLGLAVTLVAAGCVGMMLFHSRRLGLAALVVSIALVGGFYGIDALVATTAVTSSDGSRSTSGAPRSLWNIGAFFLEVGAFTFGGGLSMLAFIQDQAVSRFGWLTPQEFVDGLALGQFTPGPILMLAAFIGFNVAGVKGAAIAASTIFLPSFLMILSILPLLRKMKDVQWLKAFMGGISPAVIAALCVLLVQMAPRAAPDIFRGALLVLTVGLLLLRNVQPLPLMLGGGLIGFLSKTPVWERLGLLV